MVWEEVVFFFSRGYTIVAFDLFLLNIFFGEGLESAVLDLVISFYLGVVSEQVLHDGSRLFHSNTNIPDLKSVVTYIKWSR